MEQVRFMMIGAHPDDMELRCGGLALRLRAQGHRVKFVSMTDGSAGHQTMSREALAQRRLKETQAVARLFDIEYKVMPIPDGELEPTLAVRKMVMKEIREFAPHVIITHRNVDYHPDHRACGQVVMDCSFLVKVPLFCPEVPCPPHTPVILTTWDEFKKPTAFRPDVIVPIDDLVEKKTDGCLCHVSQFYEWLPHCEGWAAVSAARSVEEKTERLRELLDNYFTQEVRSCPELIPEGIAHAETFEWNEYGAPLTDELRRAMTDVMAR